MYYRLALNLIHYNLLFPTNLQQVYRFRVEGLGFRVSLADLATGMLGLPKAQRMWVQKLKSVYLEGQ